VALVTGAGRGLGFQAPFGELLTPEQVRDNIPAITDLSAATNPLSSDQAGSAFLGPSVRAAIQAGTTGRQGPFHLLQIGPRGLSRSATACSLGRNRISPCAGTERSVREEHSPCPSN
jgi:hypothetical protein